jgi:magnesium transporter
LSPDFLLTVHDIAPTSFRNLAARLIRNPSEFPSPLHVMEGLMEEMVTRVAYNSELVVETLDQLSHDIFNLNAVEENVDRKTKPVKISQSATVMQAVLKCLGATADLNSKINESLHSLHRMAVFFKQEVSKDERVDAKVDIILTDTMALLTQTAFLSDKITFQLDATLGMISVEQNLIIKIFSMVAVFFMPPTLIASLYGMNFEYMPELHMSFGYPVALGLMFMSSAVPYFYFRHRGWL